MIQFDIDALNLFCRDNLSKINPSRTSNKFILNHYNDYQKLFEYLDNRYNDLSFNENLFEILYRIKHKIEKNPGCKICGKNVSFLGFTHGYAHTCCRSCMGSYEHKINLENHKYENDRLNKLKIRRPELFYDWSKISEQNDNWILKNFIRFNRTHICPDTNKLDTGLWTKNPINKDIVNYIKNRFTNSLNIEENLYWLYYKIDKRPVCPVCGGYLKFNKFISGYQRVCSHSCANLHPDTKEKLINTFNERYGVSSYMLTDDFRKKSKITIKKRNKENYYNKPYSNVTYYSSKGEQKIFSILKPIYPDLLQYYRDKRYSNPRTNYCWECDFYIPSLDLFIEYQGFRTHGPHPYNKNCVEDQLRLEKLQKQLNNINLSNGSRELLKNDISVWTKKDVYKRYIAQKNGIKLLEIYEPFSKIDKNLLLYKINNIMKSSI